MRYKINKIKQPFGYRCDGDGVVVYLFNAEYDSSAIRQVVHHVYDTVEDEDGDEVINCSEYDPSRLDSEMAGNIEDELSMAQVVAKIKGGGSDAEKFEAFLKQDVLNKGIPLVFVDAESSTISQIESGKLSKIVGLYRDRLTIFIREYDPTDDY